MRVHRQLLSVSVATVAVLVSAAGVVAASTIDVSGSQVVFDNPDTDSPPDGAANDIGAGGTAVPGFSHTYVDVLPASLPDVDAKVSVLNTTGATIDELDDEEGLGTPDSMKIGLKIDTTAAGGLVELRLEFFASGTTTPVSLSGLRINVEDIDSTQFAEFDGIASYVLATGSNLTPQTTADNPAVAAGATRFAELSDTSSSSGDPTAPLFVAEVRYGTVSSLTMRFGIGSVSDASFDLDFQGASWGSTPTDVITPGGDEDALSGTGFDASLIVPLALVLVGVGLLLTGPARRRRPT